MTLPALLSGTKKQVMHCVESVCVCVRVCACVRELMCMCVSLNFAHITTLSFTNPNMVVSFTLAPYCPPTAPPLMKSPPSSPHETYYMYNLYHNLFIRYRARIVRVVKRRKEGQKAKGKVRLRLRLRLRRKVTHFHTLLH